MVRATSLLISACLGLFALASCAEQTASAAGDHVERGQQLLEDVAKAYRDAGGLTDEMEVDIATARSRETKKRSVALGPGADARLDLDGFLFTAVDGQLYMQRADLAGKYYVMPLESNVVETYKGLSGGRQLPAPPCVLRYAETPGEYMAALAVVDAKNLRVTGHAVVNEESRSYEELRLAGDPEVSVRVLVDPQTKLVTRIEAISSTDDTAITMRMNPTLHAALPRPVAFDVAGLRRMDTLMEAMTLGEGDPAPDFTLETLDGEPVTLKDLRGSMVVLDFWATWCGPCRMGLPRLEQFHVWAAKEGLPVKVLPVDMIERVKTDKAKREVVARYWKSQKFTMPTLMDYDTAVAKAYDVGSIPHRVVIGPDGVIVEVEVGFNPKLKLDEHLKQVAGKLNMAGGG